MRPPDNSLFTPAEASVLTGLSIKAVNNAIDKNMVSAVVGTRESGRLLDQQALLALVLEYRLANRFFPELRRRLFDALVASPRKAVVSLDEGLVKVDLQEPRRDLAASLRALRRARSLVVTDSEILGGEPVFRGTRVPVHAIASTMEQGSTEAEILKAYPRVTAEMVRLAPAYAQAYPVRGRPRSQPWRDRPPVQRSRERLS
ncbi:MAG TPA: DUF433 domain-containing protein [Steroidobacteraceae bacterium]|jgi:uncharacterized protein (DUF433 family)